MTASGARPEAQLAAIQGMLADLETAVAELRGELAALRRRMDEGDRRWELVKQYGRYRELHSKIADTGEV